MPLGEALLQDIAFSGAPGDVIALLGPSGVGKTSTLRILLGLDTAFEGAVHRGSARVGALFGEPRLLPWFTLGDNIRLTLPPEQAPPDIAGLLAELGLPGAERLYPRQLSLGMARRAALARAIAAAPDILVLDEPFASLDAGTAALVAARIAREASERRAVLVFAGHDVVRAAALATEILVLSGRPATVLRRQRIAPEASVAQRETIAAALAAACPFLVDAPAVREPLSHVPP